MKNFIICSLLFLSIGISLPIYAQNVQLITISGIVVDNNNVGVENVPIQFVVTTSQGGSPILSFNSGEGGLFEFTIPIENASGQGCGEFSFTDCNGNITVETICWSGNSPIVTVVLNYCAGFGSDCEVGIIDAGNGVIPSILFTDPVGQEPFTYQWNDGSSTSFILVLNPGTYCVTMTDANGCVAENCHIVSAADSCYVSIEYTNAGLGAYTVGQEPVSYLWNTGETTQYIIPNADIEEYCVTIVDNTGCTATDCFNTAEPQCDVSLLCDPVENGVELWAIGQGVGTFDYNWSTGDSTLWILVEEAGEYCVTITDALGCMADTCVYLDLNWTPDSCFVFISILDDPATDFYTLSAVSNAGPNGHYEWSTGESGLSIDVYYPGTYCVTAITEEGCVVSNCIIIEDPNEGCYVEIEHVYTDASGFGVLIAHTDNDSLYEFTWFDGTAGPIYQVPGPGEYCVVATNALTGCSATACYYVENYQDCEVHIIFEPTSTGGILYAEGWGEFPLEYLWSTGELGPEITIYQEGTYCVSVVDVAGCINSICEEIIFNNQNCWLEIELLHQDDPNTAHLTLHAITSPSNIGVEIVWSDGTTGPFLEVPNVPGTYCATAFYANGCIAEACYTISSNCWVGIELIAENPNDGFDTLVAFTSTALAAEFIWSNGDVGPFLGVSSPGEYCVTAIFPDNCAATACFYYNPVICKNLAQIDFGDCDFPLGIGWNGQECITISGCSTIGPDGVDYEAYFFESFDVCYDHCGTDECLNVAEVDFGLCDAILGVGWDGQECVYISGCSPISVDGIDYSNHIFPDMQVCFDHCGIDDCVDVGNIDFGPCDAVLGIGWNGEECVYISGCSPVSVDGIDYTPFIYPSMEICFDQCGEGCFDLSGLDFGLCEAIIGIGWNGQECVSFSGCSTVASDGVDYGPYFFESFDICYDHCVGDQNCSSVENPLEELEWIEQVLYEADSLFGVDILCECGYLLNQYCYGDEPIYVLETGPNTFCADVFSFYFSEQGELLCVSGGIAGLTCDQFDPNIELEFQRNIWQCDPCICPAIYDPVCGADGVTYSNSCEAECAGVEWTPGECDTTVCDSLTTGTAVIPPWLVEWIHELEESQSGCQGVISISAVLHQNEFGFFIDWWNADDGEDYIVDCLGNYVCSAGGGFGPPTCGEFQILYPVWDCESVECSVMITCDPSPNGAELFAHATGEAPFHYEWSTGDTGEWSFAHETGTYCVTVTDAKGCVAESCLFVNLDDVMDPCFSFIQIEIIEQGQAAVLTARSNSDQAFAYQWSTGSTEQSILVYQNGLYCVEVISANGCVSTACVEVILADQNYCSVTIDQLNTSAEHRLEAFAEGVAPFVYHWNTGDTTNYIVPEESSVYCVVVTDATGCVSEDCYLFDKDPNDGLVQIYGPLLFNSPSVSNQYEGYVVLFHIKETDELIAVDTAYTYQLQGTLPNYLFIDKEPGRYLTKAYITKPESQFIPTYHYSAPFWNEAEIIEAYEPFNFAMIEMIPVQDHDGDGFISGQVLAGDNFNAGEGNEWKSAGEGVPNMELLIYNQWNELLDFAITDHSGTFRFDQLDYGTYTIYLEVPGMDQAMQIVSLSPQNPHVNNLGFEINADGATTSILELEETFSYSIYPNPVNNSLNVHFQMEEKSDIVAEILTPDGKVLEHENWQITTGRQSEELDVRNLLPGLYFLQLRDKESTQTQRFVKL